MENKKWLSFFLVVAFLVQILAWAFLYRREEVIWVPGKRVLMVIAPENFRDEELFDTRSELEKAGIEVRVASTSKGTAVGMLGGRVRPDLRLEETNARDWDAIVFVGGVGCQVYFGDENALSLAKEAAELGKKVCAICIAPVILANAGLLENRKATVWDGEFRRMLEEKGAKYVNKSVVVDGNIITANGPGAASEFGRTIAKELAKLA
ncbi:MAG: DJ-1/PfpI family protein [Candidatus Hadarchaeales archaeon]